MSKVTAKASPKDTTKIWLKDLKLGAQTKHMPKSTKFSCNMIKFY